MRLMVVSTLLTYLELAGVIEATAPYYGRYQFIPHKASSEILSRFDEERAGFLRRVFACATKAKTWFHIDLAEAAGRLQTTRERLVRAFTYLEEQGDVTLKVANLRQGYRLKAAPTDVAGLKGELMERFTARERNDIERVHQVVTLTEQSACLVRRLLEYFGETLDGDCGHCDRCLGETIPTARSSSEPGPVSIERPSLEKLRKEYPEALGTPRQAARFLCGLASPRLTRAKLNRHPLFGSQAEVPFRRVLEAVSAS